MQAAFLWLLPLVLVGLTACASDDTVLVHQSSTPTPSETELPETCDHVTGLFVVEDLLEQPGHPCASWVLTSAARMFHVEHGSAFRWSEPSSEASSAVLVVTALHVALKNETFPAGEDLPEWFLSDPMLSRCLFRAWDTDTGELAETTLPSFRLYHPAVPLEEWTDGFTALLPGNDQTVFAVLSPANTLLCSGEETMSPSQALPLIAALSKTPAPLAEDLVLLLGFPRDEPWSGRLSAAVARVLSLEEATRTHESLRLAGDEEGAISLDLGDEWVLEGLALGGMSGGGVFDRDARPIGIIVRGSEAEEPYRIVRASKLEPLRERLLERMQSVADWE